MDYELLFPGRFLKSVEFKGRDVTLTIASVATEMLPEDAGGEKLKGIVSFKEAKKKLVLNRTNAMTIAQMFGRETDGWVGHKVTFYPAPYQDETAIRVKGSPELKEPVVFELKLPRKKARKVRLLPTGKGAPTPPPMEDDGAPDIDQGAGEDFTSLKEESTTGGES
jgi:hypothetical protein